MRVFLSDSFHGSRRNLKKKSLQALRVVAEYGSPTMFLTLTANPKWEEILRQIGKEQDAFDRPEIVAMVFKEKLLNFMNNLRCGKYFDGNVPVYVMYVIEWQARGLPHVHIVFRLSNHPVDDVEAYADRFVCAERSPARVGVDSVETIAYKQAVDKYMIHKCYPVAEGGCLQADGRCKRQYVQYAQPCTVIDDRGFCKYRRRDLFHGDDAEEERNFMVVPHNREVLLDWDGHANLELCGVGYVSNYLYKYLYKGPKTKCFEIAKDTGRKRVRNDVVMHIRGRYLCGSEAIWRVFKNDTYPSPSPSVITVKVIMPEEMDLHIFNKNTSPMEVYLRRPVKYKDLTYSQFWSQYLYGTTPSQGAVRKGLCSEVLLPGRAKKYYVWSRADTADRTLVRVGTVSHSSGEKFFLRLLLLYNVIEPSDVNAGTQHLYKKIRTVNGAVHHSFQEAAVQSGLVEDVEVMFELFREHEVVNAYNLRVLFVNLSVDGYPTKFVLDDVKYRELMTIDLKQKHPQCNEQLIYEYLLQELQVLLQKEHCKRLDEFGMPSPQNVDTELQHLQAQYGTLQQESLLRKLMEEYPLTAQMIGLFSQIAENIDNALSARLSVDSPSQELKLHFVTGLAGTGKTHLGKKFMAYARSKGGVAVGCAATALAAAIYDDQWWTAHSLFAFPVESDGDEVTARNLQCQLHAPKYKQRRELLESSCLIVWDEVCSNHRQILDSLVATMHGLPNTVMILMGGYEQILPIVGFNASKAATLDACMCKSPLWSRVRTFVLERSLRMQTLADCETERKWRNEQYEDAMNMLSYGATIADGYNYFLSTDADYIPENVGDADHHRRKKGN
jgi:hypothetical protein